MLNCEALRAWIGSWLNPNGKCRLRRESMTMTTGQKTKLLQAKLNLVAKYQRLAKIAKSKPKRVTFNHQSERYRRQAQELSKK